MTKIQKQTEEWYKEYYLRKGKERNDILTNPEVLFQVLAFQKSVVEALRELPTNRNWYILDIGCGSGGSLLQFLSFGFAPSCLYGIDIIPERIYEGKERFPNIKFSCGDASQTNYNSNYFDIVMESTMFIQLTDDDLSQRIADEMLRVVKPLGYLMLIDWRYSYRHSEMKALSRKRIIKLFKVGTYTRIHCYKYGALIPPIGRLMSSHLSLFYFFVQRLFPFLVGQVTVVLQKTDKII